MGSNSKQDPSVDTNDVELIPDTPEAPAAGDTPE